MNYYPVTVVDNFYENPDEIRQFALAQDYKFCHKIKNINYTFPGSRTEDLSIINPELMQKCCLKLTSLFHNFDHDVMRWQITSCFQSVTKEFEKGVIHHDNNPYSRVSYTYHLMRLNHPVLSSIKRVQALMAILTSKHSLETMSDLE